MNQPINNPPYRAINGTTYISPNAEDKHQRYHLGAMLGLIAGVVISLLIFY